MGALKEALSRAGVDPAMTELRAALAKFINQGGTTAQIRAQVDVIDRMPGMGHVACAISSQNSASQTRPPVEDGGAAIGVPQGHTFIAPSSSSNRGGEGQRTIARNGHSSNVTPVREPTETQRRASADMRKLVRLTILDTHRIRDGRPIGDVRYGEIETLRTANAMEASLFRQIQKRVGYADHDARLRDLITADDLNIMKQKAAEISDAM